MMKFNCALGSSHIQLSSANRILSDNHATNNGWRNNG